MKILLCLTSGFLFLTLNAQTTFTITNADFTFVPQTTNVNVGDIIHFNVGSFHPVIQVIETSWTNGGNAPLNGGFSIPNGIDDVTATTAGIMYFVCNNHFDSGMKGRIIVSGSSDIQGVETKKYFLIYPNPGYDVITLSISGPIKLQEIRIVDLTGRIVQNINKPENSEKYQLDVSNLNKGVYFITLKSDKILASQKFTKL